MRHLFATTYRPPGGGVSLDFGLPFVLSGCPVTLSLDLPPCPAFCYPFIGGAPLAAAKRPACDVAGSRVQWLISVELSRTIDGICSLLHLNSIVFVLCNRRDQLSLSRPNA